MPARGSRRKCPAFTSLDRVTTLKPLSRHSCHTGERRTVPSRRYVARTARSGSSSRSAKSSAVSPLRTALVSHRSSHVQVLRNAGNPPLDEADRRWSGSKVGIGDELRLGELDSPSACLDRAGPAGKDVVHPLRVRPVGEEEEVVVAAAEDVDRRLAVSYTHLRAHETPE